MQNWSKYSIDIKQNNDDPIEAGNSLNTNCPKCKSSRKNKESLVLNVNLKQSSWFCKHCGYSGSLIYGVRSTESFFEANPYNSNLKNYLPNFKLTDSVIERFNQKSISLKTLQKLKVAQAKVYFPKLESDANSIIFPYYKKGELVNLVYYHAEKRHFEFGGIKICFGYDDISNENTYVVLDEFEKLAFTEAGINNCISLFGQDKDISNMTKSLDFLSNMEKELKEIKKFTIAMPYTEYGQSMKSELIRRLGKEKCWIVDPTEKDYSWGDILINHGIDNFKEILKKEVPVPVSGVFELSDVEDEFDDLYINGLRKGVSTGFAGLDPYYTVIPGQWTLVTGIPGHGKSNFLDALIVNLASLHDWRFAFFSPENQPIQRHFANILEKKIGKPFNFGFKERINVEEKDFGKDWLKKHFSVILPGEDENWSIDGILELAKILVFRKGIKGLVIDPWNEIDHSRKSNQTETEYISECLTKVRQFARNYDVHVWLVAHPTKMGKDQFGRYLVPTPYDVAGSSHFRNKADNAISVWRNFDGKDKDVVDIYVQKIRFKEVGKVGRYSMRFEYESGRFFEDINQDKRNESLEKATHEESINYRLIKTKPANTGLFKDAEKRYKEISIDDDFFD